MRISDVRWLGLGTHADSRGSLTAVEGCTDIPFEIKRVFYMHDVVPGAARGGHAHRETDQFAVAVSGSVRIVVSDGKDAREVILDTPSAGVLLPRMTWTCLTDFSPGAVCVVLASTHYDRSKSIRTWGEYLAERGVPLIEEFAGGPSLPKPDEFNKGD